MKTSCIIGMMMLLMLMMLMCVSPCLAASDSSALPSTPSTRPARAEPPAIQLLFEEAKSQIESLTSDTPRFAPKRPRYAKPRFGIRFVTVPRGFVADHLKVDRALPKHVVILLHGLDDVGLIQIDLLPTLIEHGHHVAFFRYPDDGPIGEAASLLLDEMRLLTTLGVERVDLVAHSMGGLVAREAVTNAFAGVDEGELPDSLPTIRQLIMVGTPNAGATLAHIRFVNELIEISERSLREGGHWRDAFLDGGGEAAIDLMPGSAFLRELDARPWPPAVARTLIVGRMFDVGDTKQGLASQRSRNSSASRWTIAGAVSQCRAGARGMMSTVSNALGDGLVSCDSALCSDAEDVIIVEADHAGLVCRHVFQPNPPAIPIILDRLRLTKSEVHGDLHSNSAPQAGSRSAGNHSETKHGASNPASAE